MQSEIINPAIHIATLALFSVTLVATTLLWKRTGGQKYWIGFPLAALFMDLHEIFEILSFYGYLSSEDLLAMLPEFAELLGSIAWIYAALGLGKIIADVGRTMQQNGSVSET